jgi:hypothetical protein
LWNDIPNHTPLLAVGALAMPHGATKTHEQKKRKTHKTTATPGCRTIALCKSTVAAVVFSSPVAYVPKQKSDKTKRNITHITCCKAL